MAAMCVAEPAPTQTVSWASRFWSIRTRSTSGSGKGATEPGAKPVASSTWPRVGSSRFPAPAGFREIDPPVAGHEHDDGTAVAEDVDRLDDLADGQPRRAHPRRSRCPIRALRSRSPAALEKGSDPLDGLAVQAHAESVPWRRNRTGIPVVSFDYECRRRREDRADRIALPRGERANRRVRRAVRRRRRSSSPECADPTCTHRVEATLGGIGRTGRPSCWSTATRTNRSKRSCGPTATAPSSRSGIRSWLRLPASSIHGRPRYRAGPEPGSRRSRETARRGGVPRHGP